MSPPPKRRHARCVKAGTMCDACVHSSLSKLDKRLCSHFAAFATLRVQRVHVYMCVLRLCTAFHKHLHVFLCVCFSAPYGSYGMSHTPSTPHELTHTYTQTHAHTHTHTHTRTHTQEPAIIDSNGVHNAAPANGALPTAVASSDSVLAASRLAPLLALACAEGGHWSLLEGVLQVWLS